MVEVRPHVLTDLAGASIRVAPAADAIPAFRPGSGFKFPVTLANGGDRSVSWSAEHPLHLAYRWLDLDGTVLERDGVRTTIPRALEPDGLVEIQLGGSTPDEPGPYRLLVSLVLEGVHWACDAASSGWTEVRVDVAAGPDWPAELRDSPGGRALRGAMAAFELKRSLKGRSFEVLPQPSEPKTTTALDLSVAAPAAEQPSPGPSVVARLRNWTRKVLGVRNLQADLQDVANAVTRQEQRSTDLQVHLDHVHQEMHARFERTEAHVHGLVEQLAATRQASTAVESALLRLAAAEDKTARELRAEIRRSAQDLHAGSASRTDRISDALSTLLSRIGEISSAASSSAKSTTALMGLVPDIQSLRTGQEAIARDLREGGVVVEIISTLRQLAALVRSRSDEQSLEKVEQALSELLQQVQAESSGRRSDRDSITLLGTQNSLKLDALLTRQAVPLPSAGLVLVRNRFGLLAIQDEDAAAIAYYLSGELPEPGTVALVERLLEPGDGFVDVGANVGIYSLIAARRVGPSGQVIAVEPMPSTMAALLTTVAINGISHVVKTHECALGAEAGTATLHAGSTSGHSTLLAPVGAAGATHDVSVRKGDDILSGVRPRLIKIDVEGWELDVLEGLRGVISDSPDLGVVVELSPVHVRRRGLRPADWFDQVRSFGWQCWRIDDGGLKLRPLVSVEEIDDRGANLFLSRELPKRLESMLA